MRIDRLDLLAFGPFTDAVLDLSGGSEGLHLVYGPNEAGKSSALRAVQQLFCGIPPRSTDNFVHPHTRMKVGALLRDRDGTTLEVVRRKGTKDTLLGPDAAEARLARLLGGVTPEEFLQKFLIDHDELVAGGKTVAGGGGDLGRVLFAAGSGLAGISAVQAKLDQEAEELFKKGGSRPQINVKLAELDAARKALKDETLRSTEWLAHDEALRAALARKEALEREHDAASRRRDRLRSLSEALDHVARRRAVGDDLRGLADAPRLSADFTFRRRDAQSRIAPSERFEADACRKVAELTEQLAALDVPGPLLEQADAIKALHLRLGSQQKARSDRARLEAELARSEADAASLLRQLGRAPSALTADPEALAALRLRAQDRAEVHELANARQALLQARDDAGKALDAHDGKVRSVAARLDALGPPRDADPLRRAVKRALAAGDLDAAIRLDREGLAREKRKAAVGLKALGLWSGTLDQLEALPVPLAETIERFGAELEAAEREVAECRRRADENQAEARARGDELARLALDGEVPTDDALAAARGDRDAAWERLKGGWDDRLVPPYERSVRDADEAADRLRREAKRVGDHARLVSERARLADARDDLVARLGRAEAGRDDVLALWSALWRPLGVAGPGTPREMLAWSRRASDLAATAGSVREKAEALARREALRDEHARALADALAPLGEPPAAAGPAASLADLAERAQEVVDAVAKEQKARDRLRDDLEARKADRPALERAAAGARADWDSWQSRWAAAVAPLDLGPDAPPAAADAVLALRAELFERLDRARADRHQLDAIARDEGRFKAEVWTLADRVAPDLAVARFDAAAAEAAAAELSDRLDRAQAARQRRDHLTAQRADAVQERDSARAEVALARGVLATLRREARCESDDQLPAVEERSSRRQALEKELTDLNARLLKLAAGAPLDPFLAEAAEADPAALAREVARLGETAAALEQERETVDQTIGGERRHLQIWDGSARAADSGQDAEDLRARIRSDVEQYARLRLASAVLRAGIERYRLKSQGPVLDRASSLFSALTLGAFAGLAVDYDERDQPVLKGVRSGTREPVGVSALSLGTADQLYLALRLATLETYLDRREPLPLVVDDILIQFDNARTRATLSALAALSARTQVLVFTHHEHLLDLAASSVPAGVLFTHTLPGRS